MISLTTLNADTNGVIMIDDYNSNFGSLDSRISRQATLDGGVVITHSGVIHGDRTFDISADIDSDQKTILEYLHGNNTILRLSCLTGLILITILLYNKKLKKSFTVILFFIKLNIFFGDCLRYN